MNCKKCGNILKQSEKFCGICGEKVESQVEIIANQIGTFVSNIEGNKNQETAMYSNNQMQTNNISNQNFNSNINNNQQVQTNMNTKKETKSLISLILGIVSIVLSFILNIFIIPVAIVGLILGIVEKNNNGKKTAGIILNSISIILSIGVLIVGMLILLKPFDSEIQNYYDNDNEYGSDLVFYGDSYQLTYNSSEWITGTVSEKSALSYSKIEDSSFLPIGRSALSEYSCDFSDFSCQTKLYDDFYSYWSEDLNEVSLYLYKDSYSFNVLEDDIYYATYNYGKSSTDLKGKYYLLVSKNKNAIMSFMISVNSNDMEKLNLEVLDLFKTIEIQEIVYDDELSSILDSMKNWNMYSNLRTGQLGEISHINGGWRILSDSEIYWEFKNGEFWWYKSINDLNDNYWYGTTQVILGREGFKTVGLEESRIDSIIARSDGKLTANDIYAVVCTPTKIISNGEDKSSTNIPVNTKWNYVWIIIDHGVEGIEAQVANIDSGEATYYVKIKD